MLTQREKIEILTDKIKHHDFFEGPFMISRREAQVILKAMDLQHKNLQRNYDRDTRPIKRRSASSLKRDIRPTKKRSTRKESFVERSWNLQRLWRRLSYEFY